MKILNTFNWRTKDVIKKLKNIKDQGFDCVQVGPLQKCKAGNEWWCLYQPLDFTIGNRLGSKKDFIELCTMAHKIGLKVSVDVVLRHVAGRDNGEPVPHEDVNNDLKRFFIDKRYLNDDSDRRHVTEGGWGLPRLDYENHELQEMYYIPYLNEILQHADLIRLDEGKHFGLPSEGYTFWTDVIGDYKGKVYAECLNTSSYILNEYTKYCKVLTDKYANMGVGSVRFIESHDNFYHHEWSNTWKMTDYERLQAFSQLMQKHHNVLFFTRPYDDLPFSQEMKYILNYEGNLC